MHLSILISALFALAASALPEPIPQAYTGPCTTNDCGASHKVCGSGYLCVGYPTLDPATRKGCTCSYG
ncbi:hypothetical protein K491DRAFT_699135 [Lophiostoma macrostomum CBS 122681]|uniref:Uncharacterized protein n=1 Tax=Lophiostoma macrostomum CBS 122681 TaxID=1314788 RepID=A0A6A6SP47_9PLEO|nr:hypothetical protein K491DRAFT_699135 [Lophiostoma macrostomum CBS 122681]